MRKPKKYPIVIKEKSSLLETWTGYSPDDLRYIAKQMEEDNILELSIEVDNCSFAEYHQSRLESQIEADVRYAKELKKWETWKKSERVRKENDKKRTIAQAKKLGLIIKVEDPHS